MPLTPNCRALMLPTLFQDMRANEPPFELPTHEVTVVDRCHHLNETGDCPRCGASDFWYVDTPLFKPSSPLEGIANCACQLIRIDGGDFKREKERDLTGITSR